MTATSEESRLIRQMYAGALQHDPEERGEYLDRVCADKPELRARVVALLDAHSQDFSTPSPRPLPPTPMIDRALARGRWWARTSSGTRLGAGAWASSIWRTIRVCRGPSRSRPSTRTSAASPTRANGCGARRGPRPDCPHPGIATVYALEEIGEQLYLASEYVPGDTLRRLVKSGPLPIEQVVDIGLQLAKALAVAHTAGVVHRDIKPENVIKTPSGVVKVLDFGLARVEGATRISR